MLAGRAEVSADEVGHRVGSRSCRVGDETIGVADGEFYESVCSHTEAVVQLRQPVSCPTAELVSDATNLGPLVLVGEVPSPLICNHFTPTADTSDPSQSSVLILAGAASTMNSLALRFPVRASDCQIGTLNLDGSPVCSHAAGADR